MINTVKKNFFYREIKPPKAESTRCNITKLLTKFWDFIKESSRSYKTGYS